MSCPFLNLIKQHVFFSHSANNKGLNGELMIIWLIMCSTVQVNVVCVRLKFKVCTCWNESHYWNVYDRCSAQWTLFGSIWSRGCTVGICVASLKFVSPLLLISPFMWVATRAAGNCCLCQYLFRVCRCLGIKEHSGISFVDIIHSLK